MAILSRDTADALSATDVPDNTGSWTIFLWLQLPTPAIVLPAYRIGLMLLETTAYTGEYLGVRFEQIEGGQRLLLVGTAGRSSSYTCGNDVWAACALRYTSGSHTATLSVLVGETWVTVGSLVQDLSAVTWASANLLSDTIAGDGGVAVSFYRQWASALTDNALLSEAESAVARAASVVTDTPLQTVLDPDDVSGHAHNWTIAGTPADLWPGPLAGPAVPGPLAGTLGLVFVTLTQTEGRWLAQRQTAMLQNVYQTSAASAGAFVLVGAVSL